VYRGWKVAAVAVAMAVVAAACGSSGKKDNGSGASSPTSAKALSGDPVVIGTMFPVNAPGVNFPDLQYVAQVAVKAVNDRGGIKGRPLKWVSCDDKGDPNVAQQCANTLIKEDKAVAMVSEVGLEGATLWPFLKQANIISWFNIPIWPDDGNSPLSYPSSLGIYAHQNVGTLVPSGKPYKHVTCVSGEGPFADLICGFAKAGLAGTSNFDMVTYPQTTTNFQATAAKVVSGKPDAIVLVSADSGTASVLQALADAGSDAPILLPSSSVGSRSIDVASKNNLDVRVAGAFGLDPKVFPARKQMEADLAAYEKSVGAPPNYDKVSDNAMSMYFGITSLADILNKIDTISTDAIQAYVSKNPIRTGVTAPLDWSKSGPVAKAPRVVNVYGTPEKVQGGKLSSTGSVFQSSFPGVTPINVADAIK